jgi:hypothetical protein
VNIILIERDLHHLASIDEMGMIPDVLTIPRMMTIAVPLRTRGKALVPDRRMTTIAVPPRTRGEALVPDRLVTTIAVPRTRRTVLVKSRVKVSPWRRSLSHLAFSLAVEFLPIRHSP